ncbi:Ig-like domain-containing protein [Clostridium sp. Marseille-Q7071]
MRKKFTIALIMILVLLLGSSATVFAADSIESKLKKDYSNNLIANYKLDEIDENTCIDTIGQYNGTYNGTISITEDNKTFRRFNGISDYIQFNNPIIPVGKKSIKFKVRVNDIPNKDMAVLNNAISDKQLIYGSWIGIDTEGKVIWNIYNGDYNVSSRLIRLASTRNICDGQWHTVLLTWDGTTNSNTAKMYIDDLNTPDISTTSKKTESNNLTSNLTIGKTSNKAYPYIFKGDLDEIEIYNEVVDYSNKAESISLDKTSMNLMKGSSEKLTATVLPEDTTNKKVIWSSSDESIAKVDENGNVTAIKEGQATIIAKLENTDLTATCEVNVSKLVEENKNNAILSISLVNGARKEYDVSMEEVNKFINWYEERANGKGSALYSFDKKINPYKSVKEYIAHDKIASFEVREYEISK